MKKSVLIVLGIIEAALLLIAVSAVGINNRAISLEEQISGAEAQINVAEKRRVDLVYNLVDTVIAYQEYEGETMRAITEARASARSGDADSAMTVLNAVSEQYPDLKANENYRQLMPKDAARLFLRVKTTDSSQLKRMTEQDALKEGIEPEYRIKIPDPALQCFANEWDRKFSKELDTYGWDADPFVWVVEFERCDKPTNWLD